MDIPKTPRQRPAKAYRNNEFLSGPDGRTVRVLCEFVEPATRFRKHKVKHTICVFGSARIEPPDVADERLKRVRREYNKTKPAPRELESRYIEAKRGAHMAVYYNAARELAHKLAEWTLDTHKPAQRLFICSGGGPGIMEAANRGAAEAGQPSIGLNISLPFEQCPNPYTPDELTLEFHYFFIRKFWFVYLAKAMIVFPGGFGTFDEFFELLTLVQTGKTRKRIPIVVFGTEFWDKIVNFHALAEYGVISPEDLDLFHFCDDVESAFQYLKHELTQAGHHKHEA